MKLMAWLSRIIVSTVLISMLSVFTSVYVINTYVEGLFRNMNIVAPAQQFELSDFLTRLTTQMNSLQEGNTLHRKNTTNSAADHESVPSDPYKEEAVEVWKQTSAQVQQQTIQSGKQVIITAEEFNKRRESLSDEDKMLIFSLLFSKVPQAEMQEISLFVENGITADELKKIEEIIKIYLSPDEVQQLMDIIDRYESPQALP